MSEQDTFILSPMNKTVFGVLELPTLLQPEDYGLDITKRELLSAFYDKNYVSNKDINTTRKEIFKSSSNINKKVSKKVSVQKGVRS